MRANGSRGDDAMTPVRRSRTATVAAWHDTPVIRTVAGIVPAWRGVLALNYHRIGDGAVSPFDRGLYSATAETFDEHLAVLAREVDVIGPGDVARALAA